MMKIIVFIMAMMALDSYATIPNIKVRLAKSAKYFLIEGQDIAQDLLGKRPKIYSGRSSLRFNCENKIGKKVNSPLMVASLTSPTGVLSWKEKRYRGKFNLIVGPYRKGCDLVNELPLETYISTLLAKEMNPNWPIEALKAQAVAARSYAYHKMVTKQVSRTHGYETYYDLENSEKHQVNGSFTEATFNTAKAALQTEGEILALGSGKITPIFFHSKCGGKTLTPEQVWQNKVEGYTSVKCPYCHNHGKKDWSRVIKKDRLKTYLDSIFKRKQKRNISEIRNIGANKNSAYISLNEQGRIYRFKKADVRNVMGRTLMPSHMFGMEENSKHDIVLKGSGFGHGVGMCQYGAFELAKRGYSYRQILAHYFPKHRIEKLY